MDKLSEHDRQGARSSIYHRIQDNFEAAESRYYHLRSTESQIRYHIP